MKKIPNFFLIGAPKCGTTSLISWLSGHPNIFVSKPKEPCYFSKDIYDPLAPRSLEEYERLFAAAGDAHLAIGEASTTYLRSTEAVPAILRYNPEAKIIVCLRNPIEMVPSSHLQLIKVGQETEANLERAWQLQAERAAGRLIPKWIHDPEAFQYGKNCALGAQVERLLTQVPRCKVHFVLLEDMQERPSNVFNAVLEFLDMPSFSPTSFPVLNERRSTISVGVAVATNRLGIVKTWLELRNSFGLGRLLQWLNSRSSVSPEITRQMRCVLERYYRDDIAKLSIVLGRDLSHWIKLQL